MTPESTVRFKSRCLLACLTLAATSLVLSEYDDTLALFLFLALGAIGTMIWCALFWGSGIVHLNKRSIMTQINVAIHEIIVRCVLFIAVAFIIGISALLSVSAVRNDAHYAYGVVAGGFCLGIMGIMVTKFRWDLAAGRMALEHFIKCQSCDWYGGIGDLRQCGGTCPSCGSRQFRSPELVDSSVSEWTEGFMPAKLVRQTEYRYIVREALTLDMIEAYLSRLWTTCPMDWWDPYGFLRKGQTAAQAPSMPRNSQDDEVSELLVRAGDLDYRGDWDDAIAIYRHIATIEQGRYAEVARRNIERVEAKRTSARS